MRHVQTRGWLLVEVISKRTLLIIILLLSLGPLLLLSLKPINKFHRVN